MKKRTLIYILISILFFSCDKYEYFAGDNYYSDSFETYFTYEDLMSSEDKFYSQITYEENYIIPDTSIVHSGTKSMKFYGVGTENDNLCKCSYAHHHLSFWEGETIVVSAWYFIDSEEDLPWLFIMDLEERASIGAGPGIRPYISKNNSFGINFKYNQPNFEQDTSNQLLVPRKQWFKLSMEVFLSQKKDGWIKLKQNDTLVLHLTDIQTLPKDILYFQQGTKGMYNSVEFGITANPTDKDLILYVDDVEVYKED